MRRLVLEENMLAFDVANPPGRLLLQLPACGSTRRAAQVGGALGVGFRHRNLLETPGGSDVLLATVPPNVVIDPKFLRLGGRLACHPLRNDEEISQGILVGIRTPHHVRSIRDSNLPALQKTDHPAGLRFKSPVLRRFPGDPFPLPLGIRHADEAGLIPFVNEDQNRDGDDQDQKGREPQPIDDGHRAENRRDDKEVIHRRSNRGCFRGRSVARQKPPLCQKVLSRVVSAQKRMACKCRSNVPVASGVPTCSSATAQCPRT